MINIIAVLILLLIHFFADFIVQTDRQATGKSKNWSDLLAHTATYSFCFYIPIFILAVLGTHFGGYRAEDLGWNGRILLFPIITFVAHTITDYFTSRLNAKLWAQEKRRLFFISVGFDQLAHGIQLILTYYFLTR